MLRIDRHHDSQLADYLSSLDYDSYVSDTADEIIADSILDDIMHRLSDQAEREVRKIVLEMAEKHIQKEREEEAERKVKESGYDWQMQGYMWLFDCEQAEIDFWLFPCPEDLIGQYGDPEKLIDAIERIPLRRRVTTVTVKRDPEAIERIQERVAVCQEYYQQLMQEQSQC